MATPDKLQTLPIKVRSIILEGNERTSPKFIEQELEKLGHAGNFGELQEQVNNSLVSLQGTELFKSVHMDIDSAGTENPEEVDILVKMKERPFWGTNISANTTVDGMNFELGASLRLRNLFGRAEVTQIDTTATKESLVTGGISSLAVSVRDIRPTFTSRVKGFFRIFKDNQDWSNLSSFRARHTGGVVGAVTSDGKHKVEYEAVVRELEPTQKPTTPLIPMEGVALVRQPSVSILAEAGTPTFKSAVRYTYTDSHLKGESYAPKSGYRVTQKVEAAGLSGDVHYLKSETAAQYHHAITPSLTASLTSRLGIVTPWSALLGRRTNGTTTNSSASNNQDNSPAAAAAAAVVAGGDETKSHVPILDRFFLDQAFIRGISPIELGGKDGKDALGNDLYAGVSAFLTREIPNTPAYVQVFGNLGTALPGASVPLTGSTLAQHTRSSVGTGVVIPTAQFGRLELNFSSPYTEKGFSSPDFRFILAGMDF